MALTSLQESQLPQATIGRVNVEPVSSEQTSRSHLESMMTAGKSCFNLSWPGGHLHNTGSSHMGKESAVPSVEQTVTNTGPFSLLVWDSKTVAFNTAVSASAQVSVLVMTLLAQYLQEEALEEIPPGSPNTVPFLQPRGQRKTTGPVSRQDTWFSEPCDIYSSPRVKHPDL